MAPMAALDCSGWMLIRITIWMLVTFGEEVLSLRKYVTFGEEVLSLGSLNLQTGN